MDVEQEIDQEKMFKCHKWTKVDEYGPKQGNLEEIGGGFKVLKTLRLQIKKNLIIKQSVILFNGQIKLCYYYVYYLGKWFLTGGPWQHPVVQSQCNIYIYSSITSLLFIYYMNI